MKKGYVNGSDMLLMIGTKAVGHCTSHTVTYTTETIDRAVKPKASEPQSSSLWKRKGVTGLAYSVKSDNLMFYNEEEYGYPELLAAWKAGEPVTVKCAERASDTSPYLTGSCIITNLEENHGAGADSTFSVSLENDGEPTIDTTKFNLGTSEAG